MRETESEVLARGRKFVREHEAGCVSRASDTRDEGSTGHESKERQRGGGKDGGKGEIARDEISIRQVGSNRDGGAAGWEGGRQGMRQASFETHKAGVPTVSLRALQRAAATVEDFCKTYFLFLGVSWEHIFFQVSCVTHCLFGIRRRARTRRHVPGAAVAWSSGGGVAIGVG